MLENSDHQQIVNLEKKMTFQEDLIETLNQTVIEQEKRIVELEKSFHSVKNLMESGDFVRKIEEEDPPPHY